MNALKTKNGSLTPYAFACGYIEQVELRGVRTTLWLEGTWHVRQHNFNTHERVFWDSFDTLGAARKRYEQAVKAVKGQGG